MTRTDLTRTPHLRRLAAHDPAYRALLERWHGPASAWGTPRPLDAPRPAPGSPPADFPEPEPDGRIRLGFLTPGLNVGGAERHMRDLMAWLPRDRFAVVGCAVWQEGSWQDAMRSEVESLCPVRFGRAAVPALYRLADVVYCWGTIPEAQQLRLKPVGCGLVLVSHGTEEWTARAMSTANQADAIVIVAEQSRRTVPEAHRDRAQVIHNAVDPGERLRVTRDREDVRRSWGVTAPEVKILGNVARVSGEKGPYCTFTAVEALRRYGMGEWVYVWAGPGAETDAVRQRSDALCPGGVFLPGAMADVGNAYHAFDAFCMPSKEDACSISMIEAMLARVPVLATGIAYVAERPEFFRVLPYKPSGDAIADALLADLRDPAGTADRVERAYRHASEYLTRPRMVREWADLLTGVAHRARARAAGPGAREHLRLGRLARACPWRSDVDCGCGQVRCGIAGRRFDVSACIDCVQTFGP